MTGYDSRDDTAELLVPRTTAHTRATCIECILKCHRHRSFVVTGLGVGRDPHLDKTEMIDAVELLQRKKITNAGSAKCCGLSLGEVDRSASHVTSNRGDNIEVCDGNNGSGIIKLRRRGSGSHRRQDGQSFKQFHNGRGNAILMQLVE